jgi:hypothetical protein
MVVAPNRSEVFTDKGGFAASERIRRWIEEVTRISNRADSSSSAVTPTYVFITSANSPYTASDNEYILADMSLGDIDINLPTSGRLVVSRKGEDNDLTLNATVSEEENPLILFDKSTASLAKIGNEWRWV